MYEGSRLSAAAEISCPAASLPAAPQNNGEKAVTYHLHSSAMTTGRLARKAIIAWNWCRAIAHISIHNTLREAFNKYKKTFWGLVHDVVGWIEASPSRYLADFKITKH